MSDMSGQTAGLMIVFVLLCIIGAGIVEDWVAARKQD